MNVYRSKIFRAGNSDALRLPRELTPGTDVEVEITKQGSADGSTSQTTDDAEGICGGNACVAQAGDSAETGEDIIPETQGAVVT